MMAMAFMDERFLLAAVLAGLALLVIGALFAPRELTPANSDAPRVTPPASVGRCAADPGGESEPAARAESLAALTFP